ATRQAGWPESPVIHQERGRRLTAEQARAITDTEAAPMSSRTRRPLTQGIFLEEDRIVLLQNLHRLRLRNADRRAAVREPVRLPPAAIATATEEIHHIRAPLSGIAAAEAIIPARPGGRGEHPLRDRLPHRAEPRFHDPLRHRRRASCHGPRILRAQEGIVWPGDV